MMKRYIGVFTLVLVLLLTSACAEEIEIHSFKIVPPSNWESILSNGDTVALMSNDSLEVVTIRCESLIAEFSEEYQEVGALILGIAEGKLLESVTLYVEETYGVETTTEFVNGRQVLTAIVEDEGVEYAVLMTLQDGYFVEIKALGLLMDSEEQIELCKEAMKWLIFSKELDNETSISPDVVEMGGDLPAEQMKSSFSINNGLMTIVLDEEKYNIFTTDNSQSSKSVQRSLLNAEHWNGYLKANVVEIMISPIEKEIKDYSVCVRIKEDEWSEIDNLKDLSKMDALYFMQGLTAGFSFAGVTEYEQYETEQALYCVFDWQIAGKYERRYATVYDNDMIYIWLQSNAPLTNEDEAFLKEMVDSFDYQ